MAVRKITLMKQYSVNKVEYIYPKTSADMVEYDDGINIKQKIRQLERMLSGDIDIEPGDPISSGGKINNSISIHNYSTSPMIKINNNIRLLDCTSLGAPEVEVI